MPGRILELHRQRQVRRPEREQSLEPAVVALDVGRDAIQDRSEALPEEAIRSREPGHRTGGIRQQRSHGTALLRLHGEPEVGVGGGQPGPDLGLGRVLVEGVVELAGRKLTRVVSEQLLGAQPGRIEAGRPRRVGEAARSRVQRAGHAGSIDRPHDGSPSRAASGP